MLFQQPFYVTTCGTIKIYKKKCRSWQKNQSNGENMRTLYEYEGECCHKNCDKMIVQISVLLKLREKWITTNENSGLCQLAQRAG